MRKIVAILLFLLGLFALERADIAGAEARTSCERVVRTEQLSVCTHRNVDAEQPSSVAVVPTARTITINGSRINTLRAPHIAATGHFHTISHYVVAQFIHRLGSFARAVDFYLYTLCQLRL